MRRSALPGSADTPQNECAVCFKMNNTSPPRLVASRVELNQAVCVRAAVVHCDASRSVFWLCRSISGCKRGRGGAPPVSASKRIAVEGDDSREEAIYVSSDEETEVSSEPTVHLVLQHSECVSVADFQPHIPRHIFAGTSRQDCSRHIASPVRRQRGKPVDWGVCIPRCALARFTRRRT